MKSFLFKSVMLTLLSLLVMTTADAWQCKVHNARGQVWMGTAATRAGAVANAMRFCSRNSAYASNCVVDGCNGEGNGYAGMWQCNSGNARGQVFAGVGATRAAATASAMGKCSANSTYARNCFIRTCFHR
jgi:hypothetical protein